MTIPDNSLLPLLSQAEKYFPHTLFSSAQIERLRQAAASLPACFLVGLECRLRSQNEPTDIWICPGLQIPELIQAGHWLQNTSWPQLQPLAQRLVAGRPPWPLRWGAWTLEFDLASPQALPLPSSFVTFASEGNTLNWQETVRELWLGSCDCAPSATEEQASERIHERCPQATLAGLGFLHPRAGAPTRLMLGLPTFADLEIYLPRHAQAVLNLVSGVADRLVLGTPLFYEQEKRQSVEAYLSSLEAWQELTSRLVAAHLCDHEKAAGLLSLAAHQGLDGNMFCTMNHVKIAVSDEGKLEVKGYPSFGYLPSA